MKNLYNISDYGNLVHLCLNCGKIKKKDGSFFHMNPIYISGEAAKQLKFSLPKVLLCQKCRNAVPIKKPRIKKIEKIVILIILKQKEQENELCKLWHKCRMASRSCTNNSMSTCTYVLAGDLPAQKCDFCGRVNHKKTCRIMNYQTVACEDCAPPIKQTMLAS